MPFLAAFVAGIGRQSGFKNLFSCRLIQAINTRNGVPFRIHVIVAAIRNVASNIWVLRAAFWIGAITPAPLG